MSMSLNEFADVAEALKLLGRAFDKSDYEVILDAIDYITEDVYREFNCPTSRNIFDLIDELEDKGTLEVWHRLVDNMKAAE